MKKPDLLIFIAVWQFITAFAALGFGFVVIAFSALPDYSGSGQSFDSMGGIMGLTVFILLLLCFVALMVASGIGLNRGRKWARTFSIVHSALSLFFPPIIGTAIGTLSIIYLVRQDVRDYFNPPPAK